MRTYSTWRTSAVDRTFVGFSFVRMYKTLSHLAMTTVTTFKYSFGLIITLDSTKLILIHVYVTNEAIEMSKICNVL